MNWLSQIDFPISVSYKTGEIKFGTGFNANLTQAHYYSKFEVINMIIFGIICTSLMSCAINSIKPENQPKFLVSVGPVMLLAFGMMFQILILSNLTHKHSFYYIKYGTFFGLIFMGIIIFLDYNFQFTFSILSSSVNQNKDLFLNLGHYFSFHQSPIELITKIQLLIYLISFFLILLSFASVSASMAAHRLMNIKIMSVESKQKDALNVIENYRFFQRILVLQVLINVIFIVFSKHILLFNHLLVICFGIFNLGFKYILLRPELQMTFLKTSQGAFELKTAIMTKLANKTDKKFEDKIQEKFKKVNSDCIKMFKESVRILLVVLVPFLIILIITCLLLLLKSNANYPGHIPDQKIEQFYFGNFKDIVKFLKINKNSCFSKSFFSNLVPIQFDEKIYEINSILEFYKAFFFSIQKFLIIAAKIILIFLIGFETFAYFLLFLFMKKINY